MAMDMNMLSGASPQQKNMQHRNPPGKVVHEFVEKYYSLMQQSPDQLFKFYKSQSIFTFSRESDGLSSVATGQEEIRHNIMYILQQMLGPIHVISKNQVDHQASRQGGLIVHISGQLVTYDGYVQHFFQSFFLDEQTVPTPGYFVLTDYLRYLDSSASPSLPQCSPPGAQPGMQTGVPVMAPEAMLCQDQCLAPPPLGPMQMMQPHGVGQQQGWVQQRIHPSMMHPVISQQPQPRIGAPGSDAPSGGFPPVAQPLLQQVNTSTTVPVVESAPCDLAEGARIPEELQPEVAEPEIGNSENGEAEAEVGAEYEEEYEASDDREPTLDDGDPPEAQDHGGGEHSPMVSCTDEGRDNGTSEAWAPGENSHATSEECPTVEEPRSWASMAGRLKEGGGQLVQSKVQGYGAPAGLAASSSPKAVSSGSTSASRERAAERNNGTSERNGDRATTNGSGEYTVWLWVSRLPLDGTLEGQEVLDCITTYLGEAGRALEFDRRDPKHEWANIAVSSQEAADAILQLSHDRKLLFRGKSLKADVHKSSYSSGRSRRAAGRSGAEGASKGSGKSGRGAVADGGDEDRSESRGDGRGAGRGRRPRKGHSSSASESTGKGSWSASTSNATRPA